jgi:putative phage-type endonuclease
MEQRTPEWIEFRKSKIGASDAPVIMGVSPWKTALQLWGDKLSPSLKTDENQSMKRGNELEPQALAKFEELTGYLMSPKVLVHPSINWMIASMDGLEIEGKTAVEIKCPGKIDHECALDGQIPEKYIPQLQHQIEVSGLQKIYYFSYSITSWKILEVSRDDNYIINLLKKESEFFDLLKKKEPPKETDRDIQEINSPEWEELAKKWLYLSEKSNEFEAEKERVKKNLIEIANQRSSKGHGLSVTKILRKGAVDYNLVPQLQGVDVEPYRKPSIESWRIS